jgi:uncharacterized damage-inducible protein DinB
MNHNTEVREEVLMSVTGLTDVQLNQKPAGKWSIAQVLEHLYMMERSIVYKMTTAMASDEEAPVEDKPIHLTPNRANKVVAPAFVMPSEEFKTLIVIQEKLRESRASLEAFVAQANVEKMLKRSFQHPVYGPIHLKQWIEFIGWHEKRHLEQIEEIKQEIGL